MLGIGGRWRLAGYNDVTFLFSRILMFQRLNDLNMVTPCMILLLTSNHPLGRRHPMEVYLGIGIQINLICAFEAPVNVFILLNNLIGGLINRILY